jgi:peptide/nickel transport system permease protein
MTQFIVRRFLLVIPVLLGIVFVTFALARLIPGDPCYVMLGERATPEECRQFRERFGLNDSILVQFGRYVVHVAQGDFGVSIRDKRPVTDILAERLPMTMELATSAMLFATLFGILLGLVASIRHNSLVDLATMMLANIGVSMPVFWLGLLLAYLFALTLKGTPFQLPPSGRLTSGLYLPSLVSEWGLENQHGPLVTIVTFLSYSTIFHSLIAGRLDVTLDALRHLILPSVAVGTIPLAIIARMTRSSMLEVLGLDYVRTARAKGLREQVVVLKHALRNAMLPIVTVIGLSFGSLLAGAVLTETVFALPGMGTRLVDAILARDYPVVQALTLAIAVIFVFVNLIVDLSYAYLDPRIRLD